MNTVYRTCPLCEATCGLAITLDGPRVDSIRGDAEDVFSHGFLCPKGVALAQLHDDPDRLRTPLVRGASGRLEEASWDAALAVVAERLQPLLEQHGRDSVAVYLGNPNAHLLSNMLYGRVLLKALGTRNVYSASSVDQLPKQLAAALMFGSGTSVPVPDLDRTDHLLMLGANPLASNGSLMTAPDARGRLRAIQRRGGRVVVVDPRRTRTAELADEHHFIRPGTDALLLFALLHTVISDGLSDPGHLAELASGFDVVRELAADFPPEAVSDTVGIAPQEIRRMAHELAAAPSAAVYGRIGTCTQEFGSLASWLVELLNFATGNLDRVGGAMFPRAAVAHANTKGEPGHGRGARVGRWHSRVRGLAEVFGELPVACLAEEIATPGEGQVRALITIAGNPAVSTPNAGGMSAALESLEFMLALDVYVNETTRHADVILPGPSPLERSHYDVALYQFAVRNIANYSPALLAPQVPQEWETLLRLTAIAAGQPPDGDIAPLDDLVTGELARRETADPWSPVADRDAAELLAELAPRRGPERLLDLLLRCGPYGDGFGARPDGLTLSALEARPHGVDLGPLEPRLPELLRTASGTIELAPPELVTDVGRLRGARDRGPADGLVLIGRRQLRSNNSWMHNLPLLASGPHACTLQIHPGDATRAGVADGETARISSRAGAIELPVEVTDTVMEGVVSIPHGWGHDEPDTALSVAAQNAGANSNVIADELLVDAPSGNAVLNGIPVQVAAVRAPVPA